MNRLLASLAGVAGLLALRVEAVIHYVDVNSTNPVAPYTNWATAASVIQNALDVSGSADEVVVTNGVYETGGSQFMPTNRVRLNERQASAH